MSDAVLLRARGEALAAPLPPLLAGARHLAHSVLLGSHGRRRAGQGDEFWQYRYAVPGDSARNIDWRRSARSDAHFIRQKEWQAVQSAMLWVDGGQSMGFASEKALPAKGERARELALAAAILLIRAGERVGLSGDALPPRGGEVQLMRLAAALGAGDAGADYGAPALGGMPARSRALFLSDFLGDMAPVEAALTQATDRGVQGVLVQVLDPQEEAFPFDGRTVFESMGGSLRHETLKAGDLRERYLARLAGRKAALRDLTRRVGWQYHCHHTDDSAASALLWIYQALERDH